jgi:hypothetical protein
MQKRITDRLYTLLMYHIPRDFPEYAHEAYAWWSERIKTLSHDQLRIFGYMLGISYLEDFRDIFQDTSQSNLMHFYVHNRYHKHVDEEAGTVRGRRKKRTRRGIFLFPKTGSRLHIIVTDKKGEMRFAFANRIPKDSADAWSYLTRYIPVSPIYSRKKFNKNLVEEDSPVRVITRYTGPECRQLLNSVQSGAIQQIAPHILRRLSDEIQSQIQAIFAGMWSVGSMHGHAHDGNFTYEFIDTSYLKSHARKLKRSKAFHKNPLDPYVVNTIPFDPKYITFDVTSYAKNPERYTLVVRLIDFDKSDISDDSPAAIHAQEIHNRPRLPIDAEAQNEAIQEAEQKASRPGARLRRFWEMRIGKRTEPLLVKKASQE